MELNIITLGDARELSKQIPDESVDLVFTDPPYHEKYLSLYEWLSEEANRILRPDGFLLCYGGNVHKYSQMVALGTHLSFYWDYILVHGGGSQLVLHRFTTAACKSLFCFVKKRSGQPRQRRVTFGLWTVPQADKRYHLWGQDATTARYYIDCFSYPGDTIFDPFTGGGTVPAVCLQLKRNFIAFEIDPLAHAVATKRIQTIQPRLFVPDTLESVHLPGID